MPDLSSSRSGSGAPLVLVHGLGARRSSWDPVLPGLSAAREVVTVDLPGHGSTPPLAGPLTLDRLTDELQAWLVAQDLAGADLVGSSMGARMVLELARRGVGRHVVALDPGGFWTPAEKRVFATSVKASFALVKGLRPALPALAGRRAGRTALLPQFSPRPWAVPAEVRAGRPAQHRRDACAVRGRWQALGRQRAAARRTHSRARAAGLGAPEPGDAAPPAARAQGRLPAGDAATGSTTAATSPPGTGRRRPCGPSWRRPAEPNGPAELLAPAPIRSPRRANALRNGEQHCSARRPGPPEPLAPAP
jgi:pimeloyl-ACP methyl ester carboxylesterase